MEEIFYCEKCGEHRFKVTWVLKIRLLNLAIIDIKGGVHKEQNIKESEDEDYTLADMIKCLSCGKTYSLSAIKQNTWPEHFDPDDIKPNYSIEDLVSTRSVVEEIHPGWQCWVCEPVLKYPMAPIYARAILDLAGKLLANSTDIKSITSLFEPSTYLPDGPERDRVLEEAKNWTDEDMAIYDDAKVEAVDDGYWVEAYVWVVKEVSDENL